MSSPARTSGSCLARRVRRCAWTRPGPLVSRPNVRPVTARGPPPAGSCHRPGQAELHPQLRGPQARVVAAARAHQAQRHHVQVIGKSGGKLLSCRIARTLCYNRYIRLLESIYDCYCVQFVISKTFCETRERVINVPRVETSLSMKLTSKHEASLKSTHTHYVCFIMDALRITPRKFILLKPKR